MTDREWRGEWTSIRRAPGMAPARRRGAGHSEEVRRDVVEGVNGAGGRRRCQEGVVDGMRRGAAPDVHRSGRGAGPRGERLGRVRSAVRSGYSAGEGTWGVREPQTGVQGACHKLVCDRLNQVIVLLLFVLNTSRYCFNASCLRHIAAATLIAAYKDHRGAARLSKSGCQISPKFLNLLMDKEIHYYFWYVCCTAVICDWKLTICSIQWTWISSITLQTHTTSPTFTSQSHRMLCTCSKVWHWSALVIASLVTCTSLLSTLSGASWQSQRLSTSSPSSSTTDGHTSSISTRCFFLPKTLPCTVLFDQVFVTCCREC
jgi:hypothetical protein